MSTCLPRAKVDTVRAEPLWHKDAGQGPRALSLAPRHPAAGAVPRNGKGNDHVKPRMTATALALSALALAGGAASAAQVTKPTAQPVTRSALVERLVERLADVVERG